MWSPSRSQTKFASVSGTVQPSAEQRLADAVALLDHGLHSLQELVLGVERGHRGGLGDRVHRERAAWSSGPPRPPARGRSGSRRAGPPGRRPWRRCAARPRSGGRGRGRCRRGRRGRGCTRGRPRRGRPGSRPGTWSRNSVSSCSRTTVPVGLFGLQTRMSLVRGVIAAAIAARSCVSSRSGTRTEVAPRQVRQRRVGLERAPGVEDLAAGVADGLHELLEHADRAAADGDVAGRARRTARRSRSVSASAPLSG